MAKYNIDYKALIYMLTPYWLRRPVMTAWLNCLVTPVVQLHSNFLKRRKNDLFRESIDSTVPRLEYMLNSIFYPKGLDDAYNYRIVLEKLDKFQALPIYLGGIIQPVDELRSVYLAGEETKYIYTDNETSEAGIDFIVKVPRALLFDESHMKLMIRSYALPDKTFDIITY